MPTCSAIGRRSRLKICKGMGSNPFVGTSASEMSYSRLASKKQGYSGANSRLVFNATETEKCWACAAVENWHIILTQNQKLASSNLACSTSY